MFFVFKDDATYDSSAAFANTRRIAFADRNVTPVSAIWLCFNVASLRRIKYGQAVTGETSLLPTDFVINESHHQLDGR